MSASKITIITGLKYEVVETTSSHWDNGKVLVVSYSLDGFNKPTMGTDFIPESCSYQEYSIRGRRICTPNGKEVFLGNAPEVEEFLGIQFDLFENLKKEKEDALFKLSKAEKGKSDALFKLSKAEKGKSDALFKLSKSQQRVEELGHMHQQRVNVWQAREDAIKTMSFLNRLKFLFTGELV